LIDGLSRAWAGDEAVVIEEHDSVVSEPRIEEFAALPDGVVQVGVDVHEGKAAIAHLRHRVGEHPDMKRDVLTVREIRGNRFSARVPEIAGDVQIL